MAETNLMSREEAAATVRRLGLKHADDAFVARTQELGAGVRESVTRIPISFDKGLAPAHQFAAPLR